MSAPWTLGWWALVAVQCAHLVRVDIRTLRLPHRWTGLLALTVCGGLSLQALASRDGARLISSLAGAVALCLLFAALALARPGHLGGGDVRLAFPLGQLLAWHSWVHWYVGLLTMFLAGTVVGVVVRVRGRRSFAFGPCMVLGTAVGLAVG